MFGIDRGIVYILEQAFDCQEGHICSIHKPLVKSAFPRHFTLIQLKTPLRYPLRQSPLKSSISPLFIPSKITTLTQKIHSNPYKSNTFSNSPKNTIFNNKTTSHKPPKIQSQNLTNTSKINTFTIQYKSKFHTSIEVQNLSHHKSHNEHNQKFTLISNSKRE